jgi:hypothetical protein
MSPLDLLASIRRAGLKDDAARVLLAIGQDLRRFGDIQAATGLSEWEMRRTVNHLKALGAIRLDEPEIPKPAGLAHRATHGLGPGKIVVYSLTAHGIALVRSIFENRGPVGRSTLPPGVPLSLTIKAHFSFLG